ncbi:MAG: hypothetical protein GTO03_06440, partial [Planctomycetales bacterium]|nr:hypothetical protein [Planctomycetales bacterium]
MATAQTQRQQESVGVLRRLWEQVNPFAPTPRASAEQLTNTAYQVVTPALLQVESADEARAVLRTMVEDPGRMAEALGRVPLGEAADEARPLLQAVLDDVDQFPSMRGPFDRQTFIADLDTAMIVRALEMSVVTDVEVTGYRAFANGFKGLMSEFYLRTPGYAMRNAVGDLITVAWDGCMTFDSRANIDDFFTRFGPATRRVSNAVAAGAQTEVSASRLPGVLGRISQRLGQAISAQ